MATMARNMDRQVNRTLISPEDKIAALARIKPAPTTAMFDDADLVIEAATEKEDVKRAIFKQLVPHLKPSLPAGVQHVVDLDHPAGREHRPAGKVHRHALHEPGAGDEAGGDHPRHRHR